MSVLEQMQVFMQQRQKQVTVNGVSWRYYQLGTGRPILWLTGGLRRAALGFDFLERLGQRRLVIAPDYPPVQTIGEFTAAFDAMLQAAGVERVTVGGQSYGGLLAQAYLAQRPELVERLILSSTGPADYGKAWLPVEYLCNFLARVLPEQQLKNLLAGGLLKFMTLPEAERAEWRVAVEHVMHHELRRADVISHFAVAADLIRRRLITPQAFQDWHGSISVLSAANDPTQSQKDFPRYAKLFGRAVQVIDMGQLGHTAALFNPEQYVAWIESLT